MIFYCKLAFQLTFSPGRWGLPGNPAVWTLHGNSGEFPSTRFPFLTAIFVSFLWCGDCSEAAGHFVFEVLADCHHYSDAHRDHRYYTETCTRPDWDWVNDIIPTSYITSSLCSEPRGQRDKAHIKSKHLKLTYYCIYIHVCEVQFII